MQKESKSSLYLYIMYRVGQKKKSRQLRLTVYLFKTTEPIYIIFGLG